MSETGKKNNYYGKTVLDTMKDISKQVRDTIKNEKAEKSNTSDDIMDILGLS